jgi:hypothetical protein
MHKLRRTSFVIVVLLAAATACLMPSVSWTDPSLQATLQALTIEAAIRGTQQAMGPGTATAVRDVMPTASQTASPTASVTATPSLTPEPSLTPTFTTSPTTIVIASLTAAVPLISVSVPTNCRAGPGLPYHVEGYLLVGEAAQIVARDPTGNYWQIPNPDDIGDYCWVWNGYATISGYTGGLPMYTPPPTPTPTATATPSPSFDLSYEGLVWCTSVWWAQIEIENTGPGTFRSIEFTLRDLDLDSAVSDEANQFARKPNCSSSTSEVSLSPNESVIVSSPALDNDPGGHKLRARIMLCTKTDVEGECIIKTLNFTP